MRKISQKEQLNKVGPMLKPLEFLSKIALILNLEIFLAAIVRDRNKMILAIVVFLAVVYVDYSFILVPQMRKLGEIKPQVSKLKKDIDELNLDSIRMQGQAQQQKPAEIISKEIISSDQMPLLIEEISRLAVQEEVKISQVEPVRSPSASKDADLSLDGDSYSVTFIDLDIFAGYHALGRFLAALENHSNFLQIDELNIQRNNDNLFEHDIDLTVKTYVKD